MAAKEYVMEISINQENKAPLGPFFLRNCSDSSLVSLAKEHYVCRKKSVP